MIWKIEYPYGDVEKFVLNLPAGLLAKYIHLTDLMLEFGANLGMPHTKPMADGIYELRVKSKEGLVRVFYCTKVGKRIIMLNAFFKKSQKTPAKELQIARKRFKEVNNET